MTAFLGVLYLLVFLAAGCTCVRFLLPQKSLLTRVWLGVSLGLLLMMWLPALIAFAVDFTWTAHLLALIPLAGLTAGCFFLRDPSPVKKWDAREKQLAGQMLMVVLPLTLLYFHIYAAGLVFQFGYNIAAALLRALGDSKATLYFLLVSSVLNVVLDLAFVAGLGMGVAGAAIATVLSQIASCVIGFAYMHRRYALLRFSLRELRMDLKTAGRILQVGAPMAIQQSIVSCGFLFLQRLVNYYGESMIASYTVASRMENILMIPVIGIQNTMATFAGQNMGAQRPDRVSKGLGQGVLVSLGMTLVLCLAQIAGIPLIIRAFQLDAGAADICRLHLFSSAVAIPIFAVYFPANGMCQGVGEGFHATFYALLALGLRVVFAYALHKTSLFGYTAIWWSQAMSWTITLVVCYVHFFRGKWKDKSLIS